MSIIVVGTVALDGIESPEGKRDIILGGSAFHFSHAASRLSEVGVVSVVGEDYPEEGKEFMRSRKVDLSGLEIMKGEKTFFWQGKYEDDFNTAIAISKLQELAGFVNKLVNKQLSFTVISETVFNHFQQFYQTIIYDVFGLRSEAEQGAQENETLDGLMQLLIGMRQKARADKDWATSDIIRDALAKLKIEVKDGADGSTWSHG